MFNLLQWVQRKEEQADVCTKLTQCCEEQELLELCILPSPFKKNQILIKIRESVATTITLIY